MTLPEGLQFLKLGWWVSHVLTVWLLYAYAYRKGRNDERRARIGAGSGTAPTQRPASVTEP